MNGAWIAILIFIQSINILLVLGCLTGLVEIHKELKDWKLYWEGDGK